MLAPLILDLSAFYEILPAMIISVSCFVAALAATSLPETNKSYGFWSFNDSKYYTVRGPIKLPRFKLHFTEKNEMDKCNLI